MAKKNWYHKLQQLQKLVSFYREQLQLWENCKVKEEYRFSGVSELYFANCENKSADEEKLAELMNDESLDFRQRFDAIISRLETMFSTLVDLIIEEKHNEPKEAEAIRIHLTEMQCILGTFVPEAELQIR